MRTRASAYRITLEGLPRWHARGSVKSARSPRKLCTSVGHRWCADVPVRILSWYKGHAGRGPHGGGDAL